MSKKSNLIHELKMNLKKECKFGVSKHQDKIIAKHQGEYKQIRGIYSTSTYNSYNKSCVNFIKYCLVHSNQIRTLEDCREYVESYLKDNEIRGLSA